MAEPVLLPTTPVTSLDGWLTLGGGEGINRARSIGPGATVQEVSLSGLRGRGGGGFPTGRKWVGVQQDPEAGSDRYVVCNGAEGEPGTFKDRAIMRRNPYQVVEGVAIAALAIEATGAFIALKERFVPEVEAVTRALAEMEAAGLVGDVPVRIVTGPDEYLFGEEKALLQVIEGDPPLPRMFPPYIHGLFATAPQMGWSARPGDADEDVDAVNPTVVNNVETLATVAHVLARGPEWHRSLGTEESPGLMVTTVVGDTVRAGVAELEMGTPMAEVLERVGGGMPSGREVKAVFSGVANPVLTPDHLDAPMSYEGLAAAGAGLGSAGFIVYDDTADMVTVARMLSRFLYVESCGQCPACKLGTGEITACLERLEAAHASSREIEVIGARLRSVTDANRCFLGEEEQILVSSILRSYPDDFSAHLEGRVMAPRPYPFPKIVDITEDGEAVYDERQTRKRPDWTYEGE